MIGSYEKWRYFGIIITHVNNMDSIDPYKDKSLKDIVAKSHEGTIIVPNSIILNEKMVDLDGLKALLVVSTNPKGIVTPEIMDETYFIFYNSCWYEISIGAPRDEFESLRPTFTECLKSFKFLPPSLK